MKEIEIYGDYIQLDQFLKKENMISSGGETGNFIEKHEIFVNGVIIKEKRKKFVSEMNFLLMEKYTG